MPDNCGPPGAARRVSIKLTGSTEEFKTMFNFDEQWREMERREQEQGDKNGLTRR